MSDDLPSFRAPVDEDFPSVNIWFPKHATLKCGSPILPPQFQSFGQALLGLSTSSIPPSSHSPMTDAPLASHSVIVPVLPLQVLAGLEDQVSLGTGGV